LIWERKNPTFALIQMLFKGFYKGCQPGLRDGPCAAKANQAPDRNRIVLASGDPLKTSKALPGAFGHSKVPCWARKLRANRRGRAVQVRAFLMFALPRPCGPRALSAAAMPQRLRGSWPVMREARVKSRDPSYMAKGTIPWPRSRSTRSSCLPQVQGLVKGNRAGLAIVRQSECARPTYTRRPWGSHGHALFERPHPRHVAHVQAREASQLQLCGSSGIAPRPDK